MKKGFLISSCVMTVAAVCFIAYALRHPELTLPWNTQVTNIFYGLYVDAVVLLLVLPTIAGASADDCFMPCSRTMRNRSSP